MGLSGGLFGCDGQKSVIYGSNKIASLNNFSISTTPDDHQLFTEDEVIESYNDIDKMSAKGTWKFVDNDKNLIFSLR